MSVYLSINMAISIINTYQLEIKKYAITRAERLIQQHKHKR